MEQVLSRCYPVHTMFGEQGRTRERRTGNVVTLFTLNPTQMFPVGFIGTTQIQVNFSILNTSFIKRSY